MARQLRHAWKRLQAQDFQNDTIGGRQHAFVGSNHFNTKTTQYRSVVRDSCRLSNYVGEMSHFYAENEYLISSLQPDIAQ
jgi:hypothetical protein